jgi:hypothetical protein
VRQLLQDVDLHVFIQRRNAQDDLLPEEVSNSFLFQFSFCVLILINLQVQLPNILPVDMIIAVIPTEDSIDPYWIAQITEVIENEIRGQHRINYKLRYYKYDTKTKAWKLGQGRGYQGDCVHDAVLLAGVNFTDSGVITAVCNRQILHALKNKLNNN